MPLQKGTRMNNQALKNKELEEYQRTIILQNINCDKETIAKIQLGYQKELAEIVSLCNRLKQQTV
jgi:hypothetical protein